MVYLLLGMSLLFIGIGYLVTENNAEYLLSGYNTMSTEEQKKFDLKSYIPHFKKFHIFLGVSFFTFGVTLNYLVSQNAGGIFLVVYPILAYIYFFFSCKKYSRGLNSKGDKAGIYILIGVLVFTIGIFALGFKEDKLIVTTATIEIEGEYGERLNHSDIKSIEITDNLPIITMKTNGFALGTIKKGYFKTNKGEIVKLILNSGNKHYILITTKQGKKIYFNTKDKPAKETIKEIDRRMR